MPLPDKGASFSFSSVAILRFLLSVKGPLGHKVKDPLARKLASDLRPFDPGIIV